MDIFNGNKLLEERIYYSIDWGTFIIDNYKERLSPFAFLYKEREKVQTLMLQETEDDFEFAINSIKKQEIAFDQFVIGYQTNMKSDEDNEPIDVVVVKAFDLREDNGHFFVQQFKIDEAGNFGKIDNLKYYGNLDLPLSKIVTENKDVSVEPPISNIISVKDEGKIKPIALIGHNSEAVIGNIVTNFLDSFLKKFDEKNLSGNFEIEIQPRENINKSFLAYIIKDAFHSVLRTDYVVKSFTHNRIPLSLIARYNEEEIFNDSTNDVIKQLNELIELLNSPGENSSNVSSENEKKWWQFWK